MTEPVEGGRASIVVLDLYPLEQNVTGGWETVCPLDSFHNHPLAWE